jgi:AraC-like DNA-binding protein
VASETSRYFRPTGLAGVEALHASFVEHVYRPHSHPTWTVAVVERGAARFSLDETQQRADRGELFILEPEAVHTGMAAVPEGWAYKVLYVPPELIAECEENDGPVPRAAKWVVFQDLALREALLRAHRALAGEPPGLAVDVPVHEALAGLRPHLRAQPGAVRARPEHAAVRRAVAHLRARWDQPVSLTELAGAARLSRFELARRFREQVGLPPHAFQLDLRVAQARRLLVAGEPPAAVAARCGFADQAHLTRVFRRAVGVTPGRYGRA